MLLKQETLLLYVHWGTPESHREAQASSPRQRTKAHSRQVGYDGLGIKVAVKSLLCYRTFHEVYFNKMSIVLLGKLTYYGCLAYLAGTCKQKGFLTSALIPLFYLW